MVAIEVIIIPKLIKYKLSHANAFSENISMHLTWGAVEQYYYYLHFNRTSVQNKAKIINHKLQISK